MPIERMTGNETVRHGYDALDCRYDSVRETDGRDVDILDQFLMGLPGTTRILDAGCGPGSPILRHLSTTRTALGLDFSRTQLEIATQKAPHAHLVQGDMTSLPLDDSVLDAITAYFTLIHVPFDEHQTVMNEFARVLGPRGKLLLSEGPDEWSGSNPDWLEAGVEMWWNIAGADTTRDQLRNAGFSITNEWEIGAQDKDNEHWVFFAAQLDNG